MSRPATSLDVLPATNDPRFLTTLDQFTLPEIIPLNKTFRDPSFGRPISDLRVKKLMKNYVPNLTTIYVSMRPDGHYAVIDGNHRVEAERRIGLSHRPARVFLDITVEQEARLYLILNEYWAQTSLTRYWAKLTAGDPTTVQITEILGKYDLRVNKNPGGGAAGTVTAVSALEHLMAELGPEGFNAVCSILYDAWQHEPRAWVTQMIDGVRQFWSRYGEVVDRRALIDRMRGVRPESILAEAMSLQGVLHGMSTGTRIGRVLHMHYNKYRRSKQLPEWTTQPAIAQQKRSNTNKELSKEKQKATKAAKKEGKQPERRVEQEMLPLPEVVTY